MKSTLRKIIIGVTIFVMTNIIAVWGYWLAGWGLLEAIYMVTITIYGVGYGEVQPINTPGLMVFTIAVIITGCTSGIYVLGGFVQFITEGELIRVLGDRKMTIGIENLKQHVIVCGFGRVGRILAAELERAGQAFVVIDTNEDRLREAEKAGMFVIIGDATEERILDSAGVRRARVVASVLPNDAANVFITLTVRELNPEVEIIARGESPSTEKKLLRSGANRVVLPASIGASRIAKLITNPSAEQWLAGTMDESSLNEELDHLGLEISEIPVPVGSDYVNHRLEELHFGDTNQFVVVAVRQKEGELLQNPDPDYRLQADDTLVIVTSQQSSMKIRKKTAKQEIQYRGARG